MEFGIKHNFDEKSDSWSVTIVGEVDIFNFETMRESLLSLTLIKQRDFRIDCKDLTYIDSTALGALVAVLKGVKKYDGDIYLENLRPSLLKLLKITELDKIFKIVGDLNE